MSLENPTNRGFMFLAFQLHYLSELTKSPLLWYPKKQPLFFLTDHLHKLFTQCEMAVS
jgi:hypothetical protein